MNVRKTTKYIHEGEYIAEVDVELIETDTGWSPYLSKDDAVKLDAIKDALKKGDLKKAAKHAKVFTLNPVAV